MVSSHASHESSGWLPSNAPEPLLRRTMATHPRHGKAADHVATVSPTSIGTTTDAATSASDAASAMQQHQPMQQTTVPATASYATTIRATTVRATATCTAAGDARPTHVVQQPVGAQSRWSPKVLLFTCRRVPLPLASLGNLRIATSRIQAQQAFLQWG